MQPIIEVNSLSKRYNIGTGDDPRDALRHRIEQAFRSPSQWLKKTMRAKRSPTEFWALREVSFCVEPGSAVAIIGRNGAGKSTLLKVLSRITEPTSGCALLRGRVASLLEVGTGFHQELTGRENIFLNGSILGMRRAEIAARFDEIVAFSEIDQFVDTPVKRYSSGMYVRLAFAVAAHLEPEILIVDEVLAVGDAQFQKKCLGKMQNVARGGRTVLFVSHSIAAVQALCSHGLYLKSGQVCDFGPINNVVLSYHNDAKSSAGLTTATRALLRGFTLQNFWINSAVIETGEPLSYCFVITSQNAFSLNELQLILFTESQSRVASVDFRENGIPTKFQGRESRKFSGIFRSLPLVEGNYCFALYLSSGSEFGNFYDLATFTVSPATRSFNFAPYPASARGVIELNHSMRPD